jgi:hypothetical protein
MKINRVEQPAELRNLKRNQTLADLPTRFGDLFKISSVVRELPSAALKTGPETGDGRLQARRAVKTIDARRRDL